MSVSGDVKIRALAVLLALAATARAADLRAELAQKHAALGKKLERPGCWVEMRRELLLALELDPDQKDARARLGYKRVGSDWKGDPAPAKPSRTAVPEGLAKELAALHAEGSGKLASAARAAKDAGDEKEARALAGLALDEDRTCARARALLGHEKMGERWTSPRERAVRSVFEHALEAAKGEEPPPAPGDEGLEKLLGLGPLERREGAHAVYLSTKAAKADLLALARTVDVIRHAWAELIPREEGVAAVASGTPVKKTKARWIVVSAAEHDAFVEHAVTDESRHPLAKQLRSHSGWTEVEGEKLFLYECCLDDAHRCEWAALTAVKTLVQQTLPRNVPPPGFLVEGLARFFAGRATGRVDISFVSPKVSLSVHERAAWGFDDLRASVRAQLALAVEGDLRRLVAKSLNDMEDSDSELALAFVEHLLEERPKELPKLAAELSPGERPLATLERVCGTSIESLERELREWAREEY